MRRRLTLICVLLTSLVSQATTPATAPAGRRVLIISVDGLRPDLVLRGDTPTLHHLIGTGAYTFWAQTTAVAVTIPSHVSMLTGARPQIHQIEWNHDLPLSRPVYPAVPTLFEVAHRAGYTTGMVAGKSKFDVFEKPGTLDVQWTPTEEVISDREVLSHALDVISAGPPQVLFVHFPETDKVGHAAGWATAKQMETIHNADNAIGVLLGTLASKGLLEQTLVIVTADHGGAGKAHGADDVRSRCIPWICVGPGVLHGVDLTAAAAARVVRTEDTFATACQFLNLPIDPALDGKPVVEAFDRRDQELLTDAAPTETPPLATATTQPATTRPAELVLRPHAVAQTRAMENEGDAADDPAVWVNPTDAAKSTIIGTDKKAGLCVYDLHGALLQTVSNDTHPDNVDVLYGFMLGGRPVDLAVAGTRAKGARGVKIWSIDPASGWLSDVTAGGVIPAFDNTEPYGSCVYKSPRDGTSYYFVNNKHGRVEQYRLDAKDGTIGATRVREFGVSSQVEGCVCDDRFGVFYLGEEDVGIWKFDAEPDGGDAGTLIAKVGEHGLTADVEGLTLYDGPGLEGYLIASSQGNSTFKVYERKPGNAFVATIDPAADMKVDDVSDTDGIAAVSCPLGPDFPRGLLVVQDGETPDGRQNFKLFDWRDVAGDRLTTQSAGTPRTTPLTAARR